MRRGYCLTVGGLKQVLTQLRQPMGTPIVGDVHLNQSDNQWLAKPACVTIALKLQLHVHPAGVGSPEVQSVRRHG